MPHDASVIQAIRQLQSAGRMTIPVDSGIGQIGRPRAVGPQGGRIASAETFFDFYINNVPPPDIAKQMDPDIEQKCRLHPDVAAAHQKRIISVSAMPWRIEPNPDAPEPHYAKEIADHVRKVLKNIPNLNWVIKHLQYAVLVGGQGLEVQWNQEVNGVEIPVAINPVHMSRFSWDRQGNLALLTRYTPVWGSYISGNPQWQQTTNGGGRAGVPVGNGLPHGRFIYHIFQQGQGQWDHPEFQGFEYAGIGLDIPLYYVVTWDIFCLKFRMKFLERYAIPPTWLYAPMNRLTSRETLQICDSLRGESVVRMPRMAGQPYDNEYHAEQPAAPTGSFDFFSSHTDGYTLPRVNAIMLLSSSEAKGQGEGGGKSEGYSSTVANKDAGPALLYKDDAQNISQTINNQFIPSIVWGRYPNERKEYFPIFSLEPKEEKDRMQELQIAKAASELVPISEDHVYDVADLPKPQPNQKTVGGQQQGQQGMPAGGQPGTPPQPGGNGTKTQVAFPQGNGIPKNPVGQGLKGGDGAIVNRGF